jgi:hypothetical protein
MLAGAGRAILAVVSRWSARGIIQTGVGWWIERVEPGEDGVRRATFRFSFLLAGVALAVVIAELFLWYGARQAPDPVFLPAVHVSCGQPVSLRVEDYELWGGTRWGDDLELARIDFCDAVQVVANDGQREVWFWLEVEVVNQVFPYAGWGFYWVDVNTPFPADDREPRNPWWSARNALRGYPNEIGYTGGQGVLCPHQDTTAWGLDLFFYDQEGFQLPVGMKHAGWVCMYFDLGQSIPDAFTVTVRPDRARITQWVDKLFVTQNDGRYPAAPLSLIYENELCFFAQTARPESVRPGELCDRLLNQ